MPKTDYRGWISGLGRTLLEGLLGLALAGCAAAGPDSANDPFEATNRDILAVNNALDRRLLSPTVRSYLALPEGLRRGAHKFLHNLALPTIFINDVLQGEPRRAGDSAARFVVNSSLGVGGLFDPATRMGASDHSEDFGQTLAVWGVGEGPFLMRPFLGPSNPRDTLGLAVDTFLLDPTNYIHFKNHLWWSAGRKYFTLLDLRAQSIDTIEGIQRSSVDYYASLRSLYRQLRASQIRNGAAEKAPELPDF